MPNIIGMKLAKNLMKVKNEHFNIFRMSMNSIVYTIYFTELFQMSTGGTGRKRAYVPKQMKYAQNKSNDAKRRKVEDKSNKKSSDDGDQKREFKSKFTGKAKKQENSDRKFKNKRKSDDDGAAKRAKKIKLKKSKGKKKSHRNKNK